MFNNKQMTHSHTHTHTCIPCQTCTNKGCHYYVEGKRDKLLTEFCSVSQQCFSSVRVQPSTVDDSRYLNCFSGLVQDRLVPACRTFFHLPQLDLVKLDLHIFIKFSPFFNFPRLFVVNFKISTEVRKILHLLLEKETWVEHKWVIEKRRQWDAPELPACDCIDWIYH